jgi:hypothetical protein
VRRPSVKSTLGAITAAVFVVAAWGCAGADEAGELPLGRQVSAQGTLTPTVHIFAEPVLARVEVLVDREHVDPDRVRLQTDFLPYDIQASAKRRTDRGRFTELRYEWLLSCLRVACIPEILPSAAGDAESGRGERRTFALPAARVLYDDPEGEERTLTRATWPELVSVSRIKQSDVPEFGGFVFKSSVAPLPEPDYRVSPTVLGAGLLAGALVLLALPAVLVIGWWRRRRPEPEVVVEPELSPLEKALRLVEWAGEREDGTERREALEVLAVELEAVDSDVLADSARGLAWSPASPSPQAAGVLVEQVRERNGLV